MKKDLIKKLKAFILDSSASEWEQNNALEILKRFKKQWFDVWEIPQPVRPKPQEKPPEKIITDIQVTVRVFTSMKTFYVDVYVSKKIPFQRIIKKSFNIPITAQEWWQIPGKSNIQSETVYKTIFQQFRDEYIRFDKVDVEKFTIIEKWEPFNMWSELIKESDDVFWDITYWSPEAFNEYSSQTFVYQKPF